MPIPDTEITARLVSLYGGATPNLLTGIADRESTYRQFDYRILYGVNERWPLESYDGGSHIGLMMVPVTLANAWDWLQNTANGAALFQEKFAAAGRIETRIRDANPGLRALTATEREKMALVLYGPYANADLSMQYYIPAGTPVDWIVNSANNSDGVNYADYVVAHVR